MLLDSVLNSGSAKNGRKKKKRMEKVREGHSRGSFSSAGWVSVLCAVGLRLQSTTYISGRTPLVSERRQKWCKSWRFPDN